MKNYFDQLSEEYDDGGIYTAEDSAGTTWLSPALKQLLDERLVELESGNVKFYTWEEIRNEFWPHLKEKQMEYVNEYA
ncbi:MAG: hypothetical protein LBP96_01860 [Bacteroidales bacterium]|jgi:hypothetical protein|nr:hypothetical protein [Bacteroidales bacterium]